MQKDLFGNNIFSFEEIRKLDKFYTKNTAVKKSIREINFGEYDLVIEPSAGNGSFSRKIKHKNLISLDLEPESDGIKKKDWFDYKIPKKYKNVLVIGNPPFGSRNILSKKFIEHSLEFSNVSTIAFILPNVYKKHTLQKVIPNN
jgi:predicted RNA methylase